MFISEASSKGGDARLGDPASVPGLLSCCPLYHARRTAQNSGGASHWPASFAGGVTFFGDGLLDIDMWGNGHAEYPCFDWLGSERVVMDSTGQTVQGAISYDAFGQTVATSGNSSNPYMFGATSAYRTDGDAGLMQVEALAQCPQSAA